MLLTEPGKRASEQAARLATGGQAAARFCVRPCVHLFGRTKTSDRSRAVADHARRQRSAFLTVAPSFAEDSFGAAWTKAQISQGTIGRIRSRTGDLNGEIAGSRSNPGPGFCIDPSFFVEPPEPAESGGVGTGGGGRLVPPGL